MEEVLQTVGTAATGHAGAVPTPVEAAGSASDHGRQGTAAAPEADHCRRAVSMIDASLRASVLDSLAQLNREFGISLIYITHD